MVHSAGYQRDIAGVRPAVRLCGVDGCASGVYLKTDLRTSVTFSRISVSYGTVTAAENRSVSDQLDSRGRG